MVLNHPLVWIWLSQLCLSLGMNLTNPILPLYASSFGISYSMVGLVVSSFGFTRIFMEIPGGLLADRVRKKSIILVGYILTTGSHIIALLAHTYLELIVSCMISGIGSALMLTASLIYVGSIAAPFQRAKYIALFQSTFFISGIVGPTLGGVISEWSSLRSIFGVSTIFSIVGIVLLLPMKEQVDASQSIGAPLRTTVLLDVLRNPKVLALGGACFVLFFLFTSIRGTMIPLYGTDTLALTSMQIGLLFSVTSLIIMVMLLFISHRLERFVRRSVLLPFSLLFCSVSVFLIAFAADFPSFILVLVPLSIGLGILQPLPFAMVGDYAQPKTMGITMGVLRTVGDLGIILGPIIVGWLLDLDHDLYVFYLISAIVGLFSLVTWVVFIKRKQ